VTRGKKPEQPAAVADRVETGEEGGAEDQTGELRRTTSNDQNMSLKHKTQENTEPQD